MEEREYKGNIYRRSAPGEPWTLVPKAAIGGVIAKPADVTEPYKAPKAAADLLATQVNTQRAQQQISQDAATAPATIAKLNAEAEKAKVEAARIAAEAEKGAASDKQRADALNGYKAAEALDRLVNDMRVKFAAGPAKTSGLMGLFDYLPSEGNDRFDKAANAARGTVGQALGFTGGQLNTAAEANASVGPYLPSSSDYDKSAADKINRLADLANDARKKSVAILGGVPDQYGNITQPDRSTNLNVIANLGGAPAATPDRNTVVTGGTEHTTRDDALTALLDQMIRSGASADAINKALPPGSDPVSAESVVAAQQYLKAHPTYKGSLGEVTRKEPTTALNRASASPTGAFFGSASDAIIPIGLTAGQQGRDNLQAMRALNPRASLAGTIAGGVPAAGLMELGASRLLPGIGGQRLADAAYGGYQGFGNAEEGQGATGALTGALAGLAGGALGRGVSNAAGAAIGGVRNEAAQMLRDRGVPLTAGQALGGIPKTIEDNLTGLPVIGNLIQARRREGTQAFNQAAFDEALAPIGQSTAGVIGDQGIADAQGLVSNSYDQALGGVTLTPDAQFVGDVTTALNRGRTVARTGPEFESFVDRRIAPLFNSNPNHVLGGPELQDALQGLRSANFGNDAMGGIASDAAREFEGAITDLASRQAPDVVPALGNANTAYRNLNVLAGGVRKAINTDGEFSAAQLGQAARENTTRFGGKIASATPDRPFFDLQRAGQEVLPSTVGDSGTASRAYVTAAPALIGGAVAGGLTGDDVTSAATGASGGAGAASLGIGALLALGGTRRGQQALTTLLLDRPDILRTLGRGIQNRSYLGGLPAIPLALGAQSQLTAQ